MPDPADLAPILADLERPADSVPVLELSGPDAALDALLGAGPGADLLARLPGEPSELALARLRDRLWPQRHLSAIYRLAADGLVVRTALGGVAELPDRLSGGPATWIFLRTRKAALGRATTVAKFDANAEGWNGDPGSPGYGHYRWMRRLLARVARPLLGERALDAGCGAGWVGIEAARMGAMASAFDPSPAMVQIATANAAAQGVDLDARVGFVEDVPFERPFELLLNSGVISFAPDARAYLDCLDRLLMPGGRLVIGDLNPASRGFRRRRRRPLLPARELNGLRRDQLEAALTERGYRIQDRWFYQLSFPVPEAMALSEQRLSGLGCRLALGLNKLATACDHATGSVFESQFDSWIVSATKPA